MEKPQHRLSISRKRRNVGSARRKNFHFLKQKKKQRRTGKERRSLPKGKEEETCCPARLEKKKTVRKVCFGTGKPTPGGNFSGD